MPYYFDEHNRVCYSEIPPAGFAAISVDMLPLPSAAELRTQLKPLAPAQIRLVLDQFGLLAQVESAVAAGDKKLKVEWEFRIEFTRENATLNAMATALGLTAAQLDKMFEVGATL